MKARHIKKLRKSIKHYYALSCKGLFGIYTDKNDMCTRGIIIYGRDPLDAIWRAREHQCISNVDYFYSIKVTSIWAKYATMPADNPAERNIEYWM